MNIAYIRVSTVDQNEDRQLKALEKEDIKKYFIEKASAKDAKRPKLLEMLEFAREGDVIIIKDFSRLARSTQDLLHIVMKMDDKGVKLKSLKENLDTNTSTFPTPPFCVTTDITLA